MHHKVTQNQRRAGTLMGAFALAVIVVLGGLGWLLGGKVPALLVAAAVAGALLAVAWWKTDALVLRISRAQPAAAGDHARYHNLVEGLCVAHGIPKPTLYVIDDDALNGFATGRGPKHASLALTSGLLASLDRLSLEGVVAHQLTRIRDKEILVATLAVTLAAPLALLSDLLIRFTWWNGGRHGHDDPQPKGPGFLAAIGRGLLVTSPISAGLLKATVGDQRNLVADMEAVELTRYPPGLLRALDRMSGGSTVVHAACRSTAHLWIAAPLALTEEEGELSRWNQRFDTHPPIDQRIDTLREL